MPSVFKGIAHSACLGRNRDGNAGVGVAAQAETQKGMPAVLEEMVVTGSAEPNPVTPVTTRYGTQHHLVTEEQIREQQVYDFPSALRNVPGVMYQSKNLMGSQTSHSLYIRGRGASHPSADVVVLFDGVPRYGALFGQVLGDGIANPPNGPLMVYKTPSLPSSAMAMPQ
jgi:iron complex outermembrane receptor protein